MRKQAVSSLSGNRENIASSLVYFYKSTLKGQDLWDEGGPFFALSTWNICRDQILVAASTGSSSFVKINEPIVQIVCLKEQVEKFEIYLFYYGSMLFFYVFSHPTWFWFL